MKDMIVVSSLAFIAGLSLGDILISKTHAATGTTTDQEIVKTLNIQNQQLARIAASLERISGQQPGWKLPPH